MSAATVVARERVCAAGPARERGPALERAPALPALTGVRFVAALLVVLAHLCIVWHPDRLLARVFANGYAAVNLFFVLSGFVLAYSYLGPDGRLRTSARGFYIARVARLYPAYLLGALLALPPLLWAAGGPARVPGLGGVVAGTVLLVQGWSDPVIVLNVPAWSLSVEALFYALFPLLALAIARVRGRRALLLLMAVLWAAGVALPLLRPGLDPEWPPLRVPEFAFGLALGRLFTLRVRRAQGGPWSGRRVLACCAPLALAYAAGPHLPLALTQMGLIDPLCALALYALACGPQAGSPLGRPALCALGEASYALYLLHWPLWDYFSALVQVPGPADASWLGYAAAYLALATCAALLCQRYLETPARRALLLRLC